MESNYFEYVIYKSLRLDRNEKVVYQKLPGQELKKYTKLFFGRTFLTIIAISKLAKLWGVFAIKRRKLGACITRYYHSV